MRLRFSGGGGQPRYPAPAARPGRAGEAGGPEAPDCAECASARAACTHLRNTLAALARARRVSAHARTRPARAPVSVGRDVSNFFPTVVRRSAACDAARSAAIRCCPVALPFLTLAFLAPSQVINIACPSFEVKNLVYIYLVRCVRSTRLPPLRTRALTHSSSSFYIPVTRSTGRTRRCLASTASRRT